MDTIACPKKFHPEVLVELVQRYHGRLGGLAEYLPRLTLDDAQEMLSAPPSPDGVVWFDYVCYRPIKVGFGENFIRRADLYDRDNDGPGTCADIVMDVMTRPEAK